MQGSRGVGVLAIAIFAASWLAYRPGVVSQGYNLADPLLIVPTTLSLLHDGDLELGEFAAEIDPSFYGLLMIDGRPYNRYPIGGSLLIVPLVWMAGPATADESPMAHAMRVAATVAKVVAALSVALLFVVLVAVSGRVGVALGLTVVFAFATPHYPIHAGVLWTHNLAMPLLLVALLLLLVHDGRYAWIAALPLALAFVTRPTTAIAGVCLSACVAVRQPTALPRFMLLALAVIGPFVAWSYSMYESSLPPYFLGFHNQTGSRIPVRGPSAVALAGNLVSPNRGLFVFAPVLLFATWGMLRIVWKECRHAVVLRCVAVATIAHWVVVSSIAQKWWAGWSFGPRNFMEVLPLWMILLVPALEGFFELSARARAVVGSVAAIALGWSLFVAVYGANAWKPHEWNRSPITIDERPERLWEWHDMQILRGTGLQ